MNKIKIGILFGASISALAIGLHSNEDVSSSSPTLTVGICSEDLVPVMDEIEMAKIEVEETSEPAPEPVYEEVYDVPNYSGFKSYESYTALTNTSSSQYELQQLCYTDANGLRRYGDLYCVAIGTGANCSVGDIVDLELEDGSLIHCVVGDIKADEHTDSSNFITTHSDCASEFICSIPDLDDDIRDSGDVSGYYEDWGTAVDKIEVVGGNVLDYENYD